LLKNLSLSALSTTGLFLVLAEAVYSYKNNDAVIRLVRVSHWVETSAET